MANDPMGKVIPFARSAAQVRRFAAKRQEQGDALAALGLLHLSLSKAPDDAETIHSLAEAYASLECWGLSNEMYSILLQDEARAPACLYGMGSNFYAMRMYAAAHDCLALAMQNAPFADFIPPAVEMLETIEEAEGRPSRREKTMHRRMGRVMDAMDRGRVALAARQIRRVLPLDRDGGGIHTLHAFTLLACGDGAAALQAAHKAVTIDDTDVRALCAMASALKARHAIEDARRYLQRAAEHAALDDETQLVCQTACEMGEDAFVADMLLEAERQTPHSDGMLHLLAVALHNSGQREEALRRWRLLRRIDPGDTVASYRLDMAQNDALPDSLPYARQVPLSEMLARLEKLRGWIHEGNEALARQWAEDERVAYLLRWGLTCGESGIPQAICGVLATIGDTRAQALLRSCVLCDPGASRALKQSALTALYNAGAQGPFYAVMDDHLTLVHVSRAEDSAAPEHGREASALYRAASRQLKDAAADDAVRGMCRVAAAQAVSLSLEDKARAVVLAYCRRYGHSIPYALPAEKHRKVERLARRILMGD